MNTEFKLATYPKYAGQQSYFDGATVTRVPYGEPHDIAFTRYTAGYKSISERPYKLAKSKRQFKTLEAAVRALCKEMNIG